IQEGEVVWLSDLEQAGANYNCHVGVGTNDLPAAQPSDIFQIEAQYRYKELARFLFTVFHNNDSTGNGAMTRGMHEDRSDDTLFFQSFAAKVEVTPKEGLLLQASFINWHNDSMGDGDLRLASGTVADRDDACAAKQALSLGFTYDAKSIPFSFFGQYQHGWNWTYNRDVDADLATLAAIWHATEKIDFGLMGEYAWLDEVLGYEEERYGQAAANISYSFDNGITLILEYAHAWYDGDIDGAGKVEREADMIGFRTAWEF
ncbi:MAG: hypothetical protein N3A66_11795, partial [Planctomycetota bacterium]|nr:hypothetical protein [Planctomycetota bacterium]